MANFEMIKYHKKKYPEHIPIHVEKIAAHFDIEEIDPKLDVSLHTEYSYGKRKFQSALIQRFPEIITAHKKEVPQLWKSEKWALEFAEFLIALVDEKCQPSVVELHPPFNDYSSIDSFLTAYHCFEQRILEEFPDVAILIENRSGTIYSGGKFILSRIEDLYLLCEHISKNSLSLRLALDIPQLYTAHDAEKIGEIVGLLHEVQNIRDYIDGIHLWGKRLSASGRKTVHSGDLNTYFNDVETKSAFLDEFSNCFSDGKIRKMVLEVNGKNEDLLSIIADLESTNVNFV